MFALVHVSAPSASLAAVTTKSSVLRTICICKEDISDAGYSG